MADARTEITAQLLSEQGYAVMVPKEDEEDEEQTFYQRDFEKKFFSKMTNAVFCNTFLQNALRDPITQEIGKGIIFFVSQSHASKITQLLNTFADQLFPGKYNSDFAVQITSSIPNAQQYTRNFANNNLNWRSRFLEGYKTSKTRVCVTVGMMTTGYDCPDILNLAMLRPIFSPTDFIQIKGRGTRKFTFAYTRKDGARVERVAIPKETFKLFDFFANCEYFEEEFNYDEVLPLPAETGAPTGEGVPRAIAEDFSAYQPDPLTAYTETPVGLEGMKIDRKLFEKWARPIREDADLSTAVASEQWGRAIQIIRERYENKPEEFMNLDKLMRAENLDRRLSWTEVIQRIFGLIDGFKSKDVLLEEEYQKFVAIHKPENRYVSHIRTFIKAYLTDPEIRSIIETKQYARLAHNPKFGLDEFTALNGWRDIVPAYVKDYVPLNTYL